MQSAKCSLSARTRRWGWCVLDTVGGRRFVAVMACGLATTILCACGRIDAEWYVEAIKWTIVPFVMGNTISQLAPYFPRTTGSAKDPV